MTAPKVLTVEEWRQRIPWHTKTRVLDALDRAIDTQRAELDKLARATLGTRRTLSRNAHAAYARGERHDWVVLGERAYQRAHKRRTRATETEPGGQS